MSQFVGHDEFLDWGYVPAVDPTFAHFHEDPYWDAYYVPPVRRPDSDDLYVTLTLGESASSQLEAASTFQYADHQPLAPYSGVDSLLVWLHLQVADLTARLFDVTLSGPSGIYSGGTSGALGGTLGWADATYGINDFVAEADYPAFLTDLAAGEVTVTVTHTFGGPFDVGFIGLGYHPATPVTVTPPLRQFPRDDGLRRNPARANPTSRQGTLHRGPRGTYT